MKRKHLLFQAGAFLFSALAALAGSGSITGRVFDVSGPIPGTLIVAKDSDLNTTASLKGDFRLNHVPEGTHILFIQSAGYDSKEIEVVVEADQTTSLGTIRLDDLSDMSDEEAYELQDFVVLSQFERAEIRAINLKRNSPTLSDAVTATDIGKLPDRNAAEAVQRIPGVAIERDQGEGRFVSVRGLPTDYSSATLNGNRIPTAEEETVSRATAFDFFPSELIGSVQVHKALTADMEMDAIGGSIDFVTKHAPIERTIDLTLAGGYSDKANGESYSASVLYGDRLLDDKLGFLINATTWKRDWATDNFEIRKGTEVDDGNGNDVYGYRRLELRDYTGTRETNGLNLAAEYEINEDNTVYARLQYGELKDDETHYKHRLRFDKDRVELQNIRDELITEMIGGEIGGSHSILSNATFDWQLAHYENDFSYGNYPNGKDNAYLNVRFDQTNVGFEGLTDGASIFEVDGGTSDPDLPDDHLPAGFVMDPTKMTFKHVNLYKVEVNEKDNIVASGDITFDINDKFEFKTGLKFRDKERSSRFSDEYYVWDEDNFGPAPTLADLEADGYTLGRQPNGSEYLEEENANYDRFFGPILSLSQLRRFWAENQDKLILDESESALLSNGLALNRNFDVEEQHKSIYGMGTWDATDKFQLVGGLRITQTDSELSGYEYNTDTDELSRVKHDNDYTSVLPSFIGKYELRDDTNLKFAFTRTFARPAFGAISPGLTYEPGNNGEIKSGNPDLDPTYSWNYDLSVEHFFDDFGLISASVFYKDIEDPIYQSSTILPSFQGFTDVEINRPENGGDAELYGIEFNFIKQFDQLPGLMSGLGVSANLTLIDSELDIPGRDDKPTLTGQSDTLYNLAIFYEYERLTMRLALNYKSEHIVEHDSSNKDRDLYYDEYQSLDFNTSYAINDGVTIFLELNNLTNEPLRYYTGDPDRPQQVEYYGVRGMAGIKWSF